MEPRRSTMGSPLSALLIDCAGPVLRVSTRGGRFWLAARGGWEEVVGRARGGLMGIHGHPPLCMLRYEDAQRRNGSCGLLPARLSSHRSA